MSITFKNSPFLSKTFLETKIFQFVKILHSKKFNLYYLYSRVTPIGANNIIKIIYRNACWAIELARWSTICSESKLKITVRIENFDTVIVKIAYNYIVVTFATKYVLRTREIFVFSSKGTKFFQKLSIGIIYKYWISFSVSNNNLIFAIEANSFWSLNSVYYKTKNYLFFFILNLTQAVCFRTFYKETFHLSRWTHSHIYLHNQKLIFFLRLTLLCQSVSGLRDYLHVYLTLGWI